MKIVRAVLGPVAAMAATAAIAQEAPKTVSAQNPESVASAMRYAGYPVTMKTADNGDPMIETDFGGYVGFIDFYGCDKKTHRDCDSLRLTTGFDGDKPMTLTALNEAMREYRFASIYVDDQGDPWVEYDVVTLDGIPAPVFLKTLDLYSASMGTIGDAFLDGQE